MISFVKISHKKESERDARKVRDVPGSILAILCTNVQTIGLAFEPKSWQVTPLCAGREIGKWFRLTARRGRGAAENMPIEDSF